MVQRSRRFSKLFFGLLMGLVLAIGSIGSLMAFNTTTTTARIYGIYRQSTAGSNSGTTGLGFTGAHSLDPTANAMLTSLGGSYLGMYVGSFKGAIPSNGTVVYFFCLNIHKNIDPMPANYNPAAVLSPETRTKIAYLISTYYGAWYPTTSNASGNALYAQEDASAAMQLAIWHYTDGLGVNKVYFSGPGWPANNYNGISSKKVRNLAIAYVAAADANWGGYHVVDSLLFVPNTQTVNVGQPASFQVKALDTAGNPMNGVVVNLSSTSGVLSTASVTTISGGLTPSVTLTGAVPSDATLTASTARTSKIAGITYARATNPGAYQDVVLATKNTDSVIDPYGDIIIKASPIVTTNASSAVTVGNPIHDSATISGGYNPTGNISFRIYGPDDDICATPIASYNGTGVSSVTVAGNATYISANFTPSVPGDYRWIANYSGDTHNNLTTNGCNATNESVVVSPIPAPTPTPIKAIPTITTNASSAVTVGNPIHDSATLSGGDAPTGNISFRVYGPNDATCATPITSYNGTGVSSVIVSGNATYASSNFTPSAPGTYRWIANYGGDANNASTTNGCNATNESVVVSPAPTPTPVKTIPTITTNASSAVTVGNPIHDSATLSGGYNPTGNISFRVYGPNDATCATPIASYNGTGVSSVTVSGNATYTSSSFTPSAPGTYRWIANYGGDANNASTTNGCNATNESVVVSPIPTPTPAPKSGMKFKDINRNGVKDANEPGLSGWTIYVDYNNNGALDSAEPSAVTGADGSYELTGVVPGLWRVREVSQAGWTCSFPTSSDAFGCYHQETFAAGENPTGVDFGNWLAPAPTPTSPAPTPTSPAPTPTSPAPTPTSTTISPSHLPSPSHMPDTATGPGGPDDGSALLLLIGMILLFCAGFLFVSSRRDLLRS